MRQIFQSLPWVHEPEPAALQALYRRLGAQRAIKKGVVLKSGREAPKLFFLEKGLCAYLIAAEREGRPSVLSIILPGRTMGDITCLTGDRVNVVSVAWQDSVVWEVDRESFTASLLADPTLLALIAHTQVRKEESHLEGMVANFTLTPTMRLKVLFAVLFRAYGLSDSSDMSVVPLLLTNTQIGRIVNLTRVSVSRILNDWIRKGLLKKNGRTLLVNPALFSDIYDWLDSGSVPQEASKALISQ